MNAATVAAPVTSAAADSAASVAREAGASVAKGAKADRVEIAVTARRVAKESHSKSLLTDAIVVARAEIAATAGTSVDAMIGTAVPILRHLRWCRV